MRWLRQQVPRGLGGAIKSVSLKINVVVHRDVRRIHIGPAVLELLLPAGFPLPDVHRVIGVAHAQERRRAVQGKLQRHGVLKILDPHRRAVRDRVEPLAKDGDAFAVMHRPDRHGRNRVRFRPERVQRNPRRVKPLPKRIGRTGRQLADARSVNGVVGRLEDIVDLDVPAAQRQDVVNQ